MTLNPSALNEEVTVTANPGVVESTGTITQQVNVITEQQIEQRAKSVTAQIANEEVGVHLQRTAPVMSGIFVRGLTGNKVNIFIDGFRYSTAAMRGGVNTFLNLIDFGTSPMNRARRFRKIPTHTQGRFAIEEFPRID